MVLLISRSLCNIFVLLINDLYGMKHILYDMGLFFFCDL